MEKYIFHYKSLQMALIHSKDIQENLIVLLGTKKSACKAVTAIVRNNKSLLGPKSVIFFSGNEAAARFIGLSL